MKYYRLKNKEINASDYSDILLVGSTSYGNRQNGLLVYDRTGPFQPLIIISGLDDLLVTGGFKKLLEKSDLLGFQFRPAIKGHIAFVDWTKWDLEADPRFKSVKGDSEEYILSLPHSQELSDQMEGVWEVIVEENGKIANGQTFEPVDLQVDIMRTQNSGWIIVTEKFKHWLETNGDNWMEFWDLENLPY